MYAGGPRSDSTTITFCTSGWWRAKELIRFPTTVVPKGPRRRRPAPVERAPTWKGPIDRPPSPSLVNAKSIGSWGRNGRIEIVDGLEDTDEEFLEGIGPGSLATYAILRTKPQKLVGQASTLLRLRARFCDQPLHGIATERFELLIQRFGAPSVADAFLPSYHAIPPKTGASGQMVPKTGGS